MLHRCCFPGPGPFLVAAAKLHGLRDPGKLRAWLSAIARNECLRRLRAATGHAALEEAADMPAQSAGVGVAAERAELQALVRAAIDGLNPGERDVIELSLAQDLDGDELAAALGVSPGFREQALRIVADRSPAPGTPVEPVPDPIRGVFLCSPATAPVPGVHGRCGELAALTALRDVFGVRDLPDIGRPGRPAPRPFPPSRGNATTIRAERARARAQAFSSRPGGLTWPCP